MNKKITIELTDYEYEVFLTFTTIFNETPQDFLMVNINDCFGHFKYDPYDRVSIIQQDKLTDMVTKIMKNDKRSGRIAYDEQKQCEQLRKIQKMAIENNKVKQEYKWYDRERN